VLPKAITSTGLIFAALSQSALAATSCETLASLKLPDTTITLATEIASIPGDVIRSQLAISDTSTRCDLAWRPTTLWI
jgi:hypothetical protein